MNLLPIEFKKEGYLTTYKCKCGLITLYKDLCSECREIDNEPS